MLKSTLFSFAIPWICLLTLLAVIAGPAGAHVGLLSPIAGFGLFVGGLGVGGSIALVAGIVSLWRARGAEPPAGPGIARWGGAWLGIGAGGAALLVLLFLIVSTRGVPRIHDIATDPADPPAFQQALQLPANQGRDLTYPHGGAEVPGLQREAYPDLAPIALEAPPERVFEAARDTVEALGWTLTWSNAELGAIEAYETTRVFRFVDDVAIRIRPSATGSVVDLRSTSRVGTSDFGANAERIRRFAERLRAELSPA